MIYKLHMSHSFYKYECPDCGYTIDGLSEGGRLFSEDNYIQLQCPACKKVESINVPYEKEQAGEFPLSECCKAKMQKWDKGCPVCGKKMIQTVLWDDIC